MTYEVCLRKTIAVAPALAFRAWTDGPTWSQWFSGDTTVDLRVGGRFRNEDGDHGEYLEIVRDRRLRFTWDGSFHGSRIELDFEPRGDAACEVTLRHVQLAAQADAERMTTCWGWTLANLASFLETGTIITMSQWKADQARAAGASPAASAAEK